MAQRILVLGATGHIGGHVVDLALARGQRVTAFVRSPAKIERRHELLTVVPGNVLDSKSLAQGLVGHDAIISAIGPAAREVLRESTLMAESAASTVAAMQRTGVSRLAIVSAALLFPEKGLRFRLFQKLLGKHVRDLQAMEAVVRAAPIDWTIARPPRLVEAKDANYRSAREVLPDHAFTATFRGVAAFLLDCVEQATHSHEVVGVVRG